MKIRSLQPTDTVEWLRLRHALWPHQSSAQNDQEMSDILANFAQMPVFVAERPEGGSVSYTHLTLPTNREV